MKSNITRADRERQLSCGENYRPDEIKDGQFHFFKGYLIHILEGGGYFLYRKHSYASTGGTKDELLKKAMNEIVKIELEKFDKEENMENALRERIEKHVLPIMERKMQEVIDELTRG